MSTEKTYNDLPEEVRNYLFGEGVLSAYDKVIAAHGLSKDADGPLAKAVDDVLLGRSALIDLPRSLAASFGVDDAKAKTMACDLAGNVLSPISAVAGDVSGAIAKWCEKPEEFKEIKKLEIKKLEPAAPVKPPTVDQLLQHRLELAVLSFKKGVRTEQDTIRLLMRPVKVGGLEMSEEEAKAVVAAVEMKEASGIRLQVSAETKVLGVPVSGLGETKPQPANLKPANPKPVPSIPKIDQSSPMPSGSDALSSAVARVVEKTHLALDPALAKRFASIVESRMRDVRNAFETRALLEASAGKNGVGLSGRALADTVAAIETEAQAFWEAHAGERQKEREAMIARKREEEQKRKGALKEREETLLAKRYESLTGKTAGPLVESQASGDRLQATGRKADRREGPQEQAKAEVEKMKTAVQQTAKQPVKPVSDVRPRMTDVSFVRKLAGPEEELRTLALTDFRRLSSKPEEAILKIKDKVDLLAEQGYDKRIAGIKAWRASPMNQLYLLLTEEALSAGKSVGDILEARRTAGSETLTMEEVRAVMRLNGELRF